MAALQCHREGGSYTPDEGTVVETISQFMTTPEVQQYQLKR
jgi:hypothetical protein